MAAKVKVPNFTEMSDDEREDYAKQFGGDTVNQGLAREKALRENQPIVPEKIGENEPEEENENLRNAREAGKVLDYRYQEPETLATDSGEALTPLPDRS